MSLSKKQFDGLMRLVGLTKDDEINCAPFFALDREAPCGRPRRHNNDN